MNILCNINKIFTNRELATIIWCIVLIAFCISRKEIRNSLKGVIRSILDYHN